MDEDLRLRIEQALDQRVRPLLGLHQGDIELLELNDGVLRLRLIGSCSGCPTADLYLESLVADELDGLVPEIERVLLISGVSDSLLAQARELMAAGARG